MEQSHVLDMNSEKQDIKIAFITGITGQDGSYLAEFLLEKGFVDHIIDRKNMKEKLVLNSYENQLLNQRTLIETIFDCLKHKYHVWHTRHRSMLNAMTNLMAALAAYTIEPLKLSAFKLLEQQQPTIAYQC